MSTSQVKGLMKESTEDKWYSWYQSFDETHGPEQRQKWYSEAATAYRWARPLYPDEMVEKVLRQAGLSSQSSMLEIGCGPGIATALFAAKGLSIVALEPSQAACDLARRSCQSNSRTVVINSTFEDYELKQQTFDAVLAATSFHWISPDVACQKSAAALKPGGSLILLWATPPQPDEELCQRLQPIYDRYGLSEMGQERRRTPAQYQSSFEMFGNRLNESGLFQPSTVEIETHQSVYSIEKYLALLSTLSPYIGLAEQTRDDLLAALGQALAERLETGALTTRHWLASQVARLRTA